MKKCVSCGRESMDESKFCQFCGAQYPTEEKSLETNFQAQTQNIVSEAPPLPYVSDVRSSYDEQNSTPPSNNGLVWLIISSITTLLGCCCLPLGFLQIGTIVTSAISVSKYNREDYEGSKSMAKISMILFFSVLALSIILLIIFASTGYISEFFDTFSETYSEIY